MNLSADEFLSLSTQLGEKDVKMAELELKLKETQEMLVVKETENKALSQRLSELEYLQEKTAMENSYLKRVKAFLVAYQRHQTGGISSDFYAEDGVGGYGFKGAGDYQRGGAVAR